MVVPWQKRKKNTVNTAKRRLAVAHTTASNLELMNIRREFIDKFTLCELTCKAVLEGHAKEKGSFKVGQYIKLNMKQIFSAMTYFSLDIPRHILNGIFGGSGRYKKRGTKSAKQLRNGIVHAMNKEDVHEVVKRETELKDIMDSFLMYFKSSS